MAGMLSPAGREAVTRPPALSPKLPVVVRVGPRGEAVEADLVVPRLGRRRAGAINGAATLRGHKPRASTGKQGGDGFALRADVRGTL